MNVDRNKALVHRFLEGVIGQGDLSTAEELCVPDFAWHGVGVADIPNLAAYVGLLHGFFAAFPTRSMVVEDLVAEGDRVVARYAWSGVQQGAFQGLPPTETMVTVAGVGIFRLDGDKIAEEWWQEDLLGLMGQLGAIPAPQPSAV